MQWLTPIHLECSVWNTVQTCSCCSLSSVGTILVICLYYVLFPRHSQNSLNHVIKIGLSRNHEWIMSLNLWFWIQHSRCQVNQNFAIFSLVVYAALKRGVHFYSCWANVYNFFTYFFLKLDHWFAPCGLAICRVMHSHGYFPVLEQFNFIVFECS